MRMQIIEPDGFYIFILVFYLYILFNPVFAYELSTDVEVRYDTYLGQLFYQKQVKGLGMTLPN